MEIQGILVKKVAEREGVSQRNGQPWKIAEYLVEVPGQFPRHINFRVSDGNVGRLTRFESLIGKMVTVSFDIDAREYEGKWFNDITAWGIMEYITSDVRQANIEAAKAQQQAPASADPQKTDNQKEAGGESDGLPF